MHITPDLLWRMKSCVWWYMWQQLVCISVKLQEHYMAAAVVTYSQFSKKNL